MTYGVFILMKITMNMIKRIRLLVFIIIGLLLCILNYMVSSDTDRGTRDVSGCRVIRVAGGWGYELYDGNRILIHQEIIPALPGNRSFSSREDARKTGQLVLRKIKNGQLPVITVEELEELNVSYADTVMIN
jgi:hypothetical protein